MNPTKYKLNYKFQKKDERDLRLTRKAFSSFPEHFDVRALYPNPTPVFDQIHGSCTAQASTVAYMLHLQKSKLTAFVPSRLYIYANSRILAGNAITDDSGADLRTVMKAIDRYDVCDESFWPYSENDYFRLPPKTCYVAAKKHADFKYFAVNQGLKSIKQWLFDGHAVVFGIMVYESMMSDDVAKTGVVPMPDTSKEECVGGHAVVMVGWDDTKKAFLVQNSWGENWGVKGSFWLPYEYVLDPTLANDFWVFQVVS